MTTGEVILLARAQSICYLEFYKEISYVQKKKTRLTGKEFYAKRFSALSLLAWFLIPISGIYRTCLIVAGLNFDSLILILQGRKYAV